MMTLIKLNSKLGPRYHIPSLMCKGSTHPFDTSLNPPHLAGNFEFPNCVVNDCALRDKLHCDLSISMGLAGLVRPVLIALKIKKNKTQWPILKDDDAHKRRTLLSPVVWLSMRTT